MVYKFASLSRLEIKAMLGLDLTQSHELFERLRKKDAKRRSNGIGH
jgi:predicted transposase YdaD